MTRLAFQAWPLTHENIAALETRYVQRDADHPGIQGVTAGIAKGDPAAFDVFYDQWFDPALVIARRVSGRDEQTCLDLVQAAMLKAARSMPVMRTEEELRCWLTRVIHRGAIDRFRTESRRRRREMATSRGRPGHHDDTELDDRIAWLQEELDKLSPDDRTLIRLRFFAGSSLDQIGEALGITGDAAHGRIRRLIRRLRSGRSP